MAEPEDAQCSVSWYHRGDDPGLSFDEPFCISERGCDYLLRRLTASDADVDRLEALLETVRFDANKDEWLTLLRLDDVFATGVFDAGGALVGVTTCVRYRIGDDGDDRDDRDARFGWCGNVVVRSAWRGRGVARALLRGALEDVGAHRTAWLDASEMGAPLYEKAGFEAQSVVVAWTKTVSADDVSADDAARRDASGTKDAREGRDADVAETRFFSGVVRADDADAMRVLRRMDASVFGADREALLRAWLDSAAPDASFLDERVGYALAHRRGDATVLGPWGLAEAVGVAPASASRRGEGPRARETKTDAAAFVDAAVRRAVAAAARAARAEGKSTARVVAYVPEPLARSRGNGASGEGAEASLEEEGILAAGALMADALARLGFARADATTRMARRDPTCGGARAIAVPGCPDRALTVASLDLG